MGYAGWVFVGVLVAVSSGALTWFEKPLLTYFRPVQLNVLVRITTAAALAAITVPLSAFNVWSLGFSTPWSASAWIALAAFLEWTVALTAFYYALRLSSISIVTPIIAGAPLFTALLGWLFLGETLSSLTIIGMLTTVVGVVVLSHWMPVDTEPAAVPSAGAPVAAGQGAPRMGSPQRTKLLIIVPALVATVAWGSYAVLLEAAERAAGGPTTTMMLESQILGAVFLLPLLLTRRSRRPTRTPDAADKPRVVAFIGAVTVLEAIWGVLFYFMVENLGPVVSGVMMATTPVFAVMGGVLIWKERLDPLSWLGAALAITGVLVASLGGAA